MSAQIGRIRDPLSAERVLDSIDAGFPSAVD
jgi:hypothetical protein